MDWCRFMLVKVDEGRSKRVNETVRGDETRIYSYDPETKQQSTVRVFEDEPPSTKITRSKSASKRMVAVFFRHMGIVAVIAMEERSTVNAQ